MWLALGVIGARAGALPDVPAQYILTPQQFGAKADGATDDTEAIQKAINAVFARGGGIVFFPRGVYALAGVYKLGMQKREQMAIGRGFE